MSDEPKTFHASELWTTGKLNPQIYRNSWDHRFKTSASSRLAITHLSIEDYRSLYLEIFKVTAPQQPQRILDYGCGSGLLVPMVQELWPEAGYEGADISPAMVRYCARYQGKYVFWLVPEALPDMHASEPFDFVICHSVLTHLTLEDGQELLRTLHGLLSPGGRASISACIEPRQDEQISGDWGRVVYGGLCFHSALREAGFEILSWFHSGLIEQDFFGVRKVGEK